MNYCGVKLIKKISVNWWGAENIIKVTYESQKGRFIGSLPNKTNKKFNINHKDLTETIF